MYVRINGTDITSFIKSGGMKWSRNDVDGSSAGRTMDGTMHRDRVAIKYRVDYECRPLTQDETVRLMALIEPEFVTLETISPRHGPVVWTVYSNNVPATHHSTGNDGEELWAGISFPLIQQ